jgi:hypothetical protein
MIGIAVVLYSLFLTAGILGRYRPLPNERYLSIVGFVALSSMMLGRGMPLLILSVLTVFLVAFLQRAR